MLNRKGRIWAVAALLVLVLIAVVAVVRACTGESGQAAEPRSYQLAPVWRAENAGAPFALDTDTGTLLLWEEVAQFDHRVKAVDARTGKAKWTGRPRDGTSTSITSGAAG